MTERNKMYIRLCSDLKDHGKLIPQDSNVYEYITDTHKDYYVSVYNYNEEQKKQFDEKGSVKGMTKVTTNKLVFDLDNDEPEQSHQDTIDLLDVLNRRGISDRSIDTYYSGNKGYHVIVNIEQDLSPKQAKNLAGALGGHLASFDSTIYNANRILRVAGTQHPKSKLYKRQLAPSVIRSSDFKRIQELSKKSFEATGKPLVKLPQVVMNLTKKELKVESINRESSFLSEGLDLSKRPPYLSPWKYALEQGFFPDGTRNDALLILASTYMVAGYTKAKTYYALKASCEAQAQRFNTDKVAKEDIYERVDTVFSEDWSGGCYSEDNFPVKLIRYLEGDLGIPRRDKVDLEVFQDTKSVFNTFTKFAENIDKNTIKTGVKALDDNLRMTTGMLCGLLGAPSSAKTTVALEILKNTSLNGEYAAMMSMDMAGSLVFQRLAQKLTGHTSDKLFSIFKNKRTAQIKEIHDKIEEGYKNVSFSFKTAMTVDDIKNSLIHQQERTGRKFRLVIIDYLECIRGSMSDPTANISMISQQLKDLANDLDICVLLLLQPPKRVGDPSQPIKSYTDIKGSATVAQACSIVVSLWREGFSPDMPENDRFISFGVLKNRLGKLSQTDCSFDGLTGKIGELDDSGSDMLRSMRALKKLNKEDDF